MPKIEISFNEFDRIVCPKCEKNLKLCSLMVSDDSIIDYQTALCPACKNEFIVCGHVTAEVDSFTLLPYEASEKE